MNPPSQRPRSAEQFAGAYAFKDRIVAITFGRAADGSLVQGPVCFTANLSADDKVMGYAVLQALEAFLPVYAPPTDMDTRRKKQLKALGVRSERELQRNALYCSLHRTPESIEFYPTRNGGHKGDAKGYVPNESAFAVPASSELAEIGAALRGAIKRCSTVFE